MGSRTCQLCGKPLSRIWVGAGGDFCSREHRNQYRLRLGMDRLQEANKVATLMRRRENLKPLPERSESIHSLPFRPYLASAEWPKPATSRRLTPRLRPSWLPQFRTVSGCLLPQPRKTSEEAAPRLHDYVSPRDSAPRVPFVPGPRLRFQPVRMQSAGALSTQEQTSAARVPRDYPGFLAIRSLLPMMRETKARDLATCSAAHHGAPPVIAWPSPSAGLQVRVSSSRGFRARELQLPRTEIGHMAALEFVWPTWNTALVFVREGPAPLPEPADVPLPHPGLRFPIGPSLARDRGVDSARTRMLRRNASDRSAVPYCCHMPWPPSEQFYGSYVSAENRDPVLQLGSWQRAGEHPLALHLLAGEPMPQVAAVPFEPQELPFGYSALEIQTAITSAPAPAEAPRTVKKVPAKIEEDFNGGLRNWIGGTADWKLNAAGVRTGSFALFAPSLDLTDYDFEFLAHVDQRSVTWVFRATDENEYHRASIANTPGGRTFTRSSVVEGTEGLSVAKALRAPANPKSAITVQTRVRGNEFTVSMDGETVDRWTDNRLPVGGIGFISSPEDRARLYWVRIMPGNETEEIDKS